MTVLDSGQHSLPENEKDLRRREVEAAEHQVELHQRELDAAEHQAALRQLEVETEKEDARTQGRLTRVQTLALVIAAIAAAAAGWGAWQATRAVDAAQQSASMQATENRFSTAVTAIGGQSPAQQVAGLTLLRRSVASQIQAAAADAPSQRDAYDAYTTSLGILDVYLRSNTKTSQAPQLKDVYAANELKLLLDMGVEVNKISDGEKPAIDLSFVGLSGVSWPKINFGQLSAAFMPGIDLSGANLIGSRWGHATLTHSQFRCADLQGADLRFANLSGSDLRGANLSGAELPPAAQLKGVNTQGAFGNPAGLTIINPAHSWKFGSCPS
jgi:Pentapeptide repeats (8 copies)